MKTGPEGRHPFISRRQGRAWSKRSFRCRADLDVIVVLPGFDFNRFIPAGAGNPGGFRIVYADPPVHTRGCGEPSVVRGYVWRRVGSGLFVMICNHTSGQQVVDEKVLSAMPSDAGVFGLGLLIVAALSLLLAVAGSQGNILFAGISAGSAYWQYTRWKRYSADLMALKAHLGRVPATCAVPQGT